MFCSVRLLFAALALVMCGTARFAAADSLAVVPNVPQMVVHEGDSGIFSFTVTDVVNGKLTIDKITTFPVFLNGKDPLPNGKDADELSAASIVFDFCTGATLLNTGTCTFRDAFLTRDLTPGPDIDQANWDLAYDIFYHLDGVAGDQVDAVGVGVTDVVPEPSTLSFGGIALLAAAGLAHVRTGARNVQCWARERV